MGQGSKQSSQKMKYEWLRNIALDVQPSENMQIKNNLGFHLTPVTMAKIKETLIKEHLLTAGRTANAYNHYGNKCGGFYKS